MPYDPARHHRRSIRLRGYDYTQPGSYFVTLVTHERRRLFDTPVLRRIAEEQWRALAWAGRRGVMAGRVALDAWVVMPNHVHGIIVSMISAERSLLPREACGTIGPIG